jgi:hypothetical protein
VYRRYAIVSDADLRPAADMLAAMAGPGKGSIAGTVMTIRRDPAETLSTETSDLMAEGEGFEPPRASRPGGFQVPENRRTIGVLSDTIGYHFGPFHPTLQRIVTH